MTHTLAHHVGPDLGFHQDADDRFEMAQKARAHPAGVVRKITLHQPSTVFGKQLLPSRSASRGHVGEQNPVRRVGRQ